MNYSLTQAVLTNPDTQYWDSTYVNLLLPSSDSSLSQLKKMHHIFGPTGHRIKILKAKWVKIKFSIELANFYLQNFLPNPDSAQSQSR